MKLQAAILFAVSNAQRDGRVRDKEVNSAEVDDAFASYFDDANYGDANNAFGNYGDAFGADSSYDAFGDLSFGDYDLNAAYGSDVADDAGRPVEAADDDDYDGKTTFEEANNDGTRPDSIDDTTSGLTARCFNSVGTDATSWFNNAQGSWERCNGEIEACEIKVVRRSGVITQIQSKCANAHSCVDNMLNNFNPKQTAVTDGSTFSFYSMYKHMQCRPLYLHAWTPNMIGAREKQNDSTCFFCVEPCTLSNLGTTEYTTANLKANKCVGRAGTAVDGSTSNSDPFSANNQAGSAKAVSLFDEQQMGQTAVTVGGTDLALNAFDQNYYGTHEEALTRTTVAGVIVTENRVISQIQREQLNNP